MTRGVLIIIRNNTATVTSTNIFHGFTSSTTTFRIAGIEKIEALLQTGRDLGFEITEQAPVMPERRIFIGLAPPDIDSDTERELIGQWFGAHNLIKNMMEPNVRH